MRYELVKFLQVIDWLLYNLINFVDLIFMHKHKVLFSQVDKYPVLNLCICLSNFQNKINYLAKNKILSG